MSDEEIAKAPLPDGKGARMALMRGLVNGRRKETAYELTPDGRLVSINDAEKPEAETEVPRKTIPNDPETPKDPNAPSGSLLDLLAARADYFSEDAMEFILSAIDSGVDERAVRRMIAMDEGELLRICGEVG